MIMLMNQASQRNTMNQVCQINTMNQPQIGVAQMIMIMNQVCQMNQPQIGVDPMLTLQIVNQLQALQGAKGNKNAPKSNTGVSLNDRIASPTGNIVGGKPYEVIQLGPTQFKGASIEKDDSKSRDVTKAKKNRRYRKRKRRND